MSEAGGIAPAPAAEPVLASGIRSRAAERLGDWTASISLDRALLLTAITALGIGIRLFQLDTLPGEIWGDIISHYQLASRVLDGQFYTDYEFGGDGPMLSYLVAGLSLFFGLSFMTIKLTTVVAGTALIVVVYFLAKELFEKTEVAFLAAFLTAVSFWGITFSRQGKPYMLAPVFVALAVTFQLRRQYIPAGIVLGLGMYTQAAFWGAPLAFIAAPFTLLVAVAVSSVFIYNLARDPSAMLGSNAYIGEKLHAHLSPVQIAVRVLDNIWKNALSFNIRGDVVFRHNIPYHPNLDVLSGVFFLAGMALIIARIIRQRDTRLLFWLIVPFAVVQIPSVLDMHPENVPAMGRMLVTAPFVFCAIAYGLYSGRTKLEQVMAGRVSRPQLVSRAALGVVLALILAINLYNYFDVYPRSLPDGNTPFAGTIAHQIDSASPQTYSIVVGCCWGEWSQPEPDAVSYSVAKSRHVLQVGTPAQAQRALIRQVPPGAPVLVFFDPGLWNQIPPGALPLDEATSWALRKNGHDVAWVIQGHTQV